MTNLSLATSSHMRRSAVITDKPFFPRSCSSAFTFIPSSCSSFHQLPPGKTYRRRRRPDRSRPRNPTLPLFSTSGTPILRPRLAPRGKEEEEEGEEAALRGGANRRRHRLELRRRRKGEEGSFKAGVRGGHDILFDRRMDEQRREWILLRRLMMELESVGEAAAAAVAITGKWGDPVSGWR